MAILSSPSTTTHTRKRKTEPGFIATALAHPLADYYLVAGAAGLLLALGTMMVLSASSVTALVTYDDSFFFVKRQVVFLLVGLAGAWWLSRRALRTLKVIAWAAMIVAFIFLMLVFTPLGTSVNGNRNWLDLGIPFFRIQPSELAKLAMIMWGADVLARKDQLLDQPRHLLVPFVPGCALLIGLVLMEGDFGTVVVMAGIMMAVLWMVGAPLRLLGLMFLTGVVGSFVMVVSSDSRMRRFAGFLNPTADTLSTNMQPTMGVWALASGGWWGLGLGGSRQKWGGLVEAHTDFVFAVIGEELGLIGTLVVLALFLTLGAAGLRTALRSEDLFCRYLAAGVTAWFLIQALINICVVLRMLPVMGVTLPFVSYGGASLIVNLAALGVLIACTRHEPAAKLFLERRNRGPRPKMTAVITGR